MSRLRTLDTPTAPRHARGQTLPLKVGTRGSPLALWQTRHFLSIISGFCPVLRNAEAFEEHVISTEGDRVQDKRLADIGGKGLFAKEIHEALLDGQVDFAVHSLKDLETELPPGIVLACLLKREDPRDAIILGPVCGAPDRRDPLACIPQRGADRHRLGPAAVADPGGAAGPALRDHPRQRADPARQGPQRRFRRELPGAGRAEADGAGARGGGGAGRRGDGAGRRPGHRRRHGAGDGCRAA